MSFEWRENSCYAERKKSYYGFLKLQKVLILNILEMGSTVFFNPQSRWKGNFLLDTYLILKISYSKLFRDGKRRLFKFRKLLQRLYLFHTKSTYLNFLKMENTVFFNTLKWYKDNICLMFLRFPWYSLTSEVWFLMQFRWWFKYLIAVGLT